MQKNTFRSKLTINLIVFFTLFSFNFALAKENIWENNPKDSLQSDVSNENFNNELSTVLPSVIKLSDNTLLKLDFGKTKDGLSSNQLVTKGLLAAFKKAVVEANKKLSINDKITEIHISSSTNGSHAFGSNHYFGTAIDISRINNRRLINIGLNKQVIELQRAFSALDNVRENYGPYIKQKVRLNGVPDANSYVSGHRNHIHFSIQGDHNAEDCECSDSIIYKNTSNIKYVNKPIIIVD